MNVAKIYLSISLLLPSLAFAKTTETSTNFHDVKIVVTMDPDTVAPKSTPPMKLPSWSLKTFKNKKQIDFVEFKNIDAVGGDAGIFPFDGQPFDGFYTFKKDGDYDSRCLLISTTGKILNSACLELFKDSKNYYLIRHTEAEDFGASKLVRATGKLEAFSAMSPPASKSLKQWDFASKKWGPAKSREEMED
jgi:hypothetical protein